MLDEKKVQVGKYEISYLQEESNHDYDFLFIHGFLSNKDFIKKLYKLERNYGIIAYDLPCFTSNDKLTIDDLLVINREFINKVINKPTIVVGHSFGSILALGSAHLKHIKKLVSISCANAWMLHENYDHLAKILQPKTINQADETLKAIVYNPEIYGRAFPLLARSLLKAVAQVGDNLDLIMHNGVFNNEYISTKIRWLYEENSKNVDLTIIHGKNDVLIDYQTSIDLAKRLNAHSIIIDKCGHSPIFEQAEKINQIFNNLLN